MTCDMTSNTAQHARPGLCDDGADDKVYPCRDGCRWQKKPEALVHACYPRPSHAHVVTPHPLCVCVCVRVSTASDRKTVVLWVYAPSVLRLAEPNANKACERACHHGRQSGKQLHVKGKARARVDFGIFYKSERAYE